MYTTFTHDPENETSDFWFEVKPINCILGHRLLQSLEMQPLKIYISSLSYCKNNTPVATKKDLTDIDLVTLQ